jgi:hypothetical protein
MSTLKPPAQPGAYDPKRAAPPATATDLPDIRVIVLIFPYGSETTITRIIRRYTSPKGEVIFDHPYNAGYVAVK